VSEPDARRDAARTVSARFDALVRNNRFTIAVTFPTVGVALFVASAEGTVPSALAFHSLLVLAGILVMRSPLVAGVFPLVDRRALGSLLVLSAYAYGVEYVGVTTGVPYGEFAYGVDLGPTVGGIPLSLPVLFLPLVMNAYLLCLLLLGRRADRAVVRVPATVVAVVAMDLVLDPGAVALGFWRYAADGAYYGVPVSNYLGWVLSATVAVAVLDRGFDRTRLLARLSSCPFMLDDLVSFVIFWGSINAWFGNWAAVLVAALFGVGLVSTGRFDVPTWQSRRWPSSRD
jgi:putative membrane protein